MSEGMYTLADQIAELRRELDLRPRVYSRWVSDGRMTQAQCDERIGRMRAALKTLEALLEALRDEDEERRAPRLL
jgi:hypothetical protein